MNDTQLRTFLAVIKAGSFSKAEEETYISKQAMIKQINKLEEEAGAALLLRKRNGITLSEAGKVFAKGAEKLLSDEEKLLKKCRSMQKKEAVRIGNVEHQTLLDPVNEAFAARYPDIELQRMIHPNHAGEWRVENHIQDVAETFITDNGEKPKYTFTRLMYSPYYAVMDPLHPLAERERIMLSDLIPYTVMIYPLMMMSSHVLQIQQIFAIHPERLQLREDIDHQVETAFDLSNTENILIGANPFLKNISQLKLVPLAENWEREYGIIYMTPVSDAVQKYIDLAVSIYSEA